MEGRDRAPCALSPDADCGHLTLAFCYLRLSPVVRITLTCSGRLHLISTLDKEFLISSLNKSYLRHRGTE